MITHDADIAALAHRQLRLTDGRLTPMVAAAAGPEYFATVSDIYGSILGRLVLFGFTWALVHHMLGGLRHFVWDMGYGFGREAREWMARATIIASVAVTILLWVVGYAVR